LRFLYDISQSVTGLLDMRQNHNDLQWPGRVARSPCSWALGSTARQEPMIVFKD
jgi:hypothetical protein